MKFSQFSLPRRKYVAIYPTPESRSKMELWCRMNGFDVSKSYSGNTVEYFNFHATVFYTTNELQFDNKEILFNPFPIEFSSFELFGENYDTPVLKIKKNFELRKVRNFFENLGFEDEWDEWRPHMTLSYNFNNEVDLSQLTLPKFRVEIDRLVVTDLDK